MSRPTACPKCHGSMAEGFLVDTGYGQYSISAWQKGVPVVSRWFGLKIKRKAMVATTSYRCERCFYLELYAPPVDR